MSWEKHDDNCPGCRPAMIDMETGKPLPPDHPAMVALNKVFDEAPIEEREAFHAVTCNNSRDPIIMARMQKLYCKMQAALDPPKPETVH